MAFLKTRLGTWRLPHFPNGVSVRTNTCRPRVAVRVFFTPSRAARSASRRAASAQRAGRAASPGRPDAPAEAEQETSAARTTTMADYCAMTAENSSDDLKWPYRLPQGDPRHGTTNGYGNLGCRCPACRKASSENHRKYLDRVRAEGRVLSEHGTETAYSSGCRCDVCREAHNKRSREYKRRRTQLRRLEER